MDWPTLDLIIITYNRPDEIQRTIAALKKNLIYPYNRVRYLIADDASPTPYQERLYQSPIFQALPKVEFVHHFGLNLGWGGNVNRALQAVEANYIFQVEDDYVLRRPLDLRVAVAIMEAKLEIGMLRFRGTAGDHLIYHQLEAIIDPWLPDYQEGVGLPGRATYFLIDGNSPGLYIYSHGAHLKRTSFHRYYGYYPTGIKLGATEESYAHLVKDQMREHPDYPAIAIQPDFVPMWWDHIGQSYQLTALDNGGATHAQL